MFRYLGKNRSALMLSLYKFDVNAQDHEVMKQLESHMSSNKYLMQMHLGNLKCTENVKYIARGIAASNSLTKVLASS